MDQILQSAFVLSSRPYFSFSAFETFFIGFHWKLISILVNSFYNIQPCFLHLSVEAYGAGETFLIKIFQAEKTFFCVRAIVYKFNWKLLIALRHNRAQKTQWNIKQIIINFNISPIFYTVWDEKLLFYSRELERLLMKFDEVSFEM